MAQRNQIADRYRKDMQRVHTAKFLRIEASNHCRADPGEADYLRELIRRAMSEEGAVSLTAWKEWEALPVGLRIQWWERRRFLYRWTAALLFAVEHAILSRVFTGWHVVKVDAQIGRAPYRQGQMALHGARRHTLLDGFPICLRRPRAQAQGLVHRLNRGPSLVSA